LTLQTRSYSMNNAVPV